MTNAKEMFEKIGTPSFFYKDKLVRLFNIEDIASIIQQAVSDYERDVLTEKLLQAANNASNATMEHYEKEVLPGKIAEARNNVLDEAIEAAMKAMYAPIIKDAILALKSTPPSPTNSWLRQVFMEANASNESKPNLAKNSSTQVDDNLTQPKISDPMKTTEQDITEWFGTAYDTGMSIIDKDSLIAKVKEREQLATQAAEKQLEQAVDERDAAEQALSQAYYQLTGNSPEWSNNFGHQEVLEEMNDAVNLLKQALKSSELKSTLATQLAWNEAINKLSQFHEHNKHGNIQRTDGIHSALQILIQARNAALKKGE